MKIYSKFFLFIVSLPSLLFIFFLVFAENHYDLKVLSNEDLKELQVFDMKSQECGFDDTKVHTVPPFSFITQNEDTLTRDDLNGKIYITEFFFTRCPGICLTMNSEMRRVQEAIRPFKDVVILSHSADPTYDTPLILQEYAQHYEADPSFWLFLTGDKKSIYDLARCGYFLSVKPDEENADNFIHSNKFVLVDKSHQIRGFYSGTDRKEVDRLITELQVLRKSYQ